MSAPGPVLEEGALCDLCWHEPQYLGRDHLRPPAEVVYTDPLGFRYALCGAHRRSVVAGLRRAAEKRLTAPARAIPRRAYHQPTRAERRAGPRVSGEDQRRARERVGWSIRQTARELDRSRSQLQGAEYGRRPVDPVVAAWVVSVLEDATRGDTLPVDDQSREEVGVERR